MIDICARRTCRQSFLLWTLFAVLVSVLGSACQEPDPTEELPAQTVRETPEKTAPSAPIFYTVADTARRGDTLSSLMMRNRVALQEISRIAERMREDELFDVRRLRPGHILTVSRDDYGVLKRLRLEISPEEILEFQVDGDSLFAGFLEVEREVRLRKFEGTILSSFDEAIRRSGGDYRLTLKVADILAYDVDFYTEVRGGDAFELLVEERFVDDRFLGYGEVAHVAYRGARAECEAFHYSWNSGEEGGHYQIDGRAMRRAFLKSPLNFRRISSHFGNRRHPVSKVHKHHTGVDYAASTGTPVVALGDGVIDHCGWKGGYGKAIRIRHNRRIQTLYGHFKGFAKGMRKGVRVEQNQVIGYVGQTGNATGPHLHFEVIENGRQVNPLHFQSDPADPIPESQLGEFTAWAVRMRELSLGMVCGQVVPPLAEPIPGQGEPSLAGRVEIAGSPGSPRGE